MFFANYSPPLVGKSPIFDSIDGGVLQTEVESFEYDLSLSFSSSY